MRKIILAIIVIFFASSMAYSQTKVPAKVKAAFEEKFPTATSVVWDKEGKNEYEASFEMNGLKYTASFNKKGVWLETETSMTFSQLPEIIQQAFRTNYSNYEATGAAKIEDSQGEIKYEIEYIKNGKSKEVMFKDDGTEIKK
jgi:hypothetical protein